MAPISLFLGSNARDLVVEMNMRQALVPRFVAPLLALLVTTQAQAQAHAEGSVPPPSAAASMPVTLVAASGTGTTKVRDAMPESQLEAMLARARKGSVDDRRKAADEIAQLGPSALPAIHAKIVEARMGGSAGLSASLRSAREESADSMVEGLLRLKHSEKQAEAAGYKQAFTIAVLLRALTHIAASGTDSHAAIREMVALTDDHNGAFRPEITRQIKPLGESAIPALIEGRRMSPDVRRWAVAQLDAMGKRTAGEAVQVKSSQVLCEILRAYGQIHDLDAIPVVLSFVGSDRAQVRLAAREAIKLYAGEGLWKLREQYMSLTGKPSPDGWSAEQTARELFAAYDRVRLQEVYDLLDQGLKLHQDGKTAEAIAAYDTVLAREPMLDRRKEMISGYLAHADQLSESEQSKKLEIYKKCTRLDPGEERLKTIDATIAFIEAKQLGDQGIIDVDGYKRALELDPAHSEARRELERLETHQAQRFETSRRWVAGVALLVVALLGILVFGRKPKLA
jgi:hypothetical protein